MADVTLTYKGATIAELSESGSKTLRTAGKFCEADIGVEYDKPSGGNPYEKFNQFQVDNITSLRDPNITQLFSQAFAYRKALNHVYLPNFDTLNPANGSVRQFDGCGNLQSAVLPKIPSVTLAMFDGCAGLASADFGAACNRIEAAAFRNNRALNVLVLRGDTIVALANVNAFAGSPFANGGSGGTIYVPSALISAYQAATNWATVHGYGTITWAAIEGSIYETQYADGTPIPTE